MIDDPRPCTDANTYEVIDDALAALAHRKGLWLGDDHVLIGLLASLMPRPTLPARSRVPPRPRRAQLDKIATLLGVSPPEARLRSTRLAHRRREVADPTHRLITRTTP